MTGSILQKLICINICTIRSDSLGSCRIRQMSSTGAYIIDLVNYSNASSKKMLEGDGVLTNNGLI